MLQIAVRSFQQGQPTYPHSKVGLWSRYMYLHKIYNIVTFWYFPLFLLEFRSPTIETITSSIEIISSSTSKQSRLSSYSCSLSHWYLIISVYPIKALFTTMTVKWKCRLTSHHQYQDFLSQKCLSLEVISALIYHNRKSSWQKDVELVVSQGYGLVWSSLGQPTVIAFEMWRWLPLLASGEYQASHYKTHGTTIMRL